MTIQQQIALPFPDIVRDLLLPDVTSTWAGVRRKPTQQLIAPIEVIAAETITEGSLTVRASRRDILTASVSTLIQYFPTAVLVDVVHVEAIKSVSILTIPQVINDIESLTGYNKAQIGRNLLGVSRISVSKWAGGHQASSPNEAKIRTLHSLLKHAAERYSSVNELRAWLSTPRGIRAVTPQTLIRKGEIDEARMMLVATTPPRKVAIPKWLREAPTNAWSASEQRMRESVEVDRFTSGISIDTQDSSMS